MNNRKNHWDKVYTNNPTSNVSWFQKEPAISLELIETSGISKDASIIDVGGGASVLIDNLLQRGYKNVWVNDISEIPLKIARERLAGKAETINWITGDITTLENPVQFDLWHDRAVFHFLTDETDRYNYIKVLKRSMNEKGIAIISTFAIGGPTKCSGLEIEQYNSEKIMSVLGDGFKLLKEREEIHFTPANHEQKFNYFLLQNIEL